MDERGTAYRCGVGSLPSAVKTATMNEVNRSGGNSGGASSIRRALRRCGEAHARRKFVIDRGKVRATVEDRADEGADLLESDGAPGVNALAHHQQCLAGGHEHQPP
jgi:hypothetical protein